MLVERPQGTRASGSMSFRRKVTSLTLDGFYILPVNDALNDLERSQRQKRCVVSIYKII